MLRQAFATDAGIHCLWNDTAFSGVNDYDTWEKELLDDADIERHIRAGDFVPLYIHSDGVVEIQVRVGSVEAPAVLSAREAKYLAVASEPYLFRSRGRLCVSGIEYVSAGPDESVGTTPLSVGDYAVTVALLAWDEEPDMRDAQGSPKSTALPDFLVLVNPQVGTEDFRTTVETFPPTS